MNLHSIAAGAISAVNPMITVSWQQSRGYITARDGSQGPVYLPPVSLQAQVQPLAMRELQHLDGMNIQGTLRAIYITGEAQAALRVGKQGGDIFTFVDPVGGSTPQTWLAVAILETWPDWSKAVVQLQNGS
jgi:hypothetical protein